MPKNLLAHLALLAVNIIYGSSHFIAKEVMPYYLKPNTFILLRVFGATIMFWMFRYFIREKVEKKDFWRIALVGFFGVALNQLLFFQGLSITSPIDSAIIMVTSPVIVTLLSLIILKTKLTINKVAGISLGLIGAIVLIYFSGNTNTVSSMKGNLFIMANATSYSLYLVLVKPLLVKYKPLTVITYMFTFACFVVLPFGISDVQDFSFDFPLVVLYPVGLSYCLPLFAPIYLIFSQSKSFRQPLRVVISTYNPYLQWLLVLVLAYSIRVAIMHLILLGKNWYVLYLFLLEFI